MKKLDVESGARTARWLSDPAMGDVLPDSPIRDRTEPDLVAVLALFHASDLSDVITGAVYPIDGARTAH